MDGRDTSSRAQRQLPSALQLHVFSFLPPNGRALSGRMACRDAAEGLSGPQHCTASLSQPLPPRAVPWALEAGQQHVRQLPFRHKLQLLCTAAASGSEVNLEVALALLQPSIFPELLHNLEGAYTRQGSNADPGVVAVKAGHPQLLGWLLHHCPALLHPVKVLEVAATHCNLAGLQAVWEALQGQRDWGTVRSPELCQGTLDAAARSHTPDALDKVRWLLETGSGRLGAQVIEAAIGSGDLGRLRWLQERWCVLAEHDQLSAALRHADLGVVQWLVDEWRGATWRRQGTSTTAAGSYCLWMRRAAAVLVMGWPSCGGCRSGGRHSWTRVTGSCCAPLLMQPSQPGRWGWCSSCCRCMVPAECWPTALACRHF